MRDALAERLLAKVMEWTRGDVARERPLLQALASLKYDEYQQFSPGMRFVESLALWLKQFPKIEQRQKAYTFVKSRLIFLSEAEMAHFAAVMYPDVIRPLLMNRAAEIDGTPNYQVGQILGGETFKRLESSTLFFGLSDGARVDQFRRSNRELSHEQIFPIYEIPIARIEKVVARLAKRGPLTPAPVVVLLDDFSGSGTSDLRWEGGELEGKLFTFVNQVQKNEAWQNLVRFPDTTVVVALYVATEQALTYLQRECIELTKRYGAKIEFHAVQTLTSRIKIARDSPEEIVPLVEEFYDEDAQDEHTKKGGTDTKYGYAHCGLPLVLHHNTPNNSLYLLWAEASPKVQPLFERFSRHKREH